MFGHFSYLLSILIFAVPVIILEWVLGYKKLKNHVKLIFLVVILSLLIVPADAIAYGFNAWKFNPEQSLQISIFGTVLESYIAGICIATAVASAVIVWTSYQDEGRDIFHRFKTVKKSIGS